jgi:hypothetical protein
MAYKPCSQQPGLRVYATDDVMVDHARWGSHEDCPLLHTFLAVDMDERWVSRPRETMLETFHWFWGRVFDLIVEPLLPEPGHAVWLLPTADFRRAIFESRGGSAWGSLTKTKAVTSERHGTNFACPCR